MPLLDHFHPPLTPRRHWESFHSAWASCLANVLNDDLLPPEYFAEEHTHAGGRVEIDVAAFEGQGESSTSGDGPAVTATRPRLWVPPAPTFVLPGTFSDRYEVLVFREEGGARLVAAIELVSPGNKDRLDQRRTFAGKCASLLSQGIGLVVIDIVTSRRGNLHNEVVRLLEQGDDYRLAEDPDLYAVAYRPTMREGAEIDVWARTLAVGQALPAMPLALGPDLCVPIDLETTYTDTCRQRRLP